MAVGPSPSCFTVVPAMWLISAACQFRITRTRGDDDDSGGGSGASLTLVQTAASGSDRRRRPAGRRLLSRRRDAVPGVSPSTARHLRRLSPCVCRSVVVDRDVSSSVTMMFGEQDVLVYQEAVLASRSQRLGCCASPLNFVQPFQTHSGYYLRLLYGQNNSRYGDDRRTR